MMVWTSSRDVRGFDLDRISSLPFNSFSDLLRLCWLIIREHVPNIREHLSAAFEHTDSKQSTQIVSVITCNPFSQRA
jgi:hypothetical protein